MVSEELLLLTLRGLIVLTTMDLTQSWWMEYTWNPSRREAEPLGREGLVADWRAGIRVQGIQLGQFV